MAKERKNTYLGGGIFGDRVDCGVARICWRGSGVRGNRKDSVLHFLGHLPRDIDHGGGTTRNSRLTQEGCSRFGRAEIFLLSPLGTQPKGALNGAPFFCMPNTLVVPNQLMLH